MKKSSNVAAIILAGGYGTRSDLDLPKALVPVKDDSNIEEPEMPNLWHTLWSLFTSDLFFSIGARGNQLASVSILVNLRDGNKFRQFLASRDVSYGFIGTKQVQVPLNLIVEEHSTNAEKWGAYSGAIGHANFLRSNNKAIEKFLFITGDGFFTEQAFRDILAKSDKNAAIGISKMPIEEAINYGNVKSLLGRVKSFTEKPNPAISPWVWTGLLATPVRYLPTTPLERTDSWGTLLNYYINPSYAMVNGNCHVNAVKVNKWYDIGMKYAKI